MRKTLITNGIAMVLLWLFAAFGANAQRLFLSSVAPVGSTYFEIPASDTVALFRASSESRSIVFKTNQSPTVSCQAEWCTVDCDDQSLQINIEANKEKEVRSAFIQLSCKDNLHATVNVQQLGTSPALLVKERNIVLKNDVCTFGVDVLSNVDVTLSLPEWVTLDEKTLFDDVVHYRFTATELGQVGAREGILRFVPQGGMAVEVSLRQEFGGYPRFAVISDMHFGNNEGEGPLVKVPQALRHLLAKPGLDALFICGDLTDGGTASQYAQLIKVFSDSSIVPADLRVYYIMGDHDNYDINGQANYAILGQPIYDYIDIKGYPFIKLGMKGSRGYDGYSDEERAYLEKALANAARDYPGKPIFLFTHVPAYGTVYGSCAGEGGWGTSMLNDILEKYPQIVMFSGHSHFPLGDPRSIHQENFTSVNLGSTTYSEIEPNVVDEGIHPNRYNYVTEGIIVEADRESNLTIERWDTYNDEEMLPRWSIQAPHDGTQFSYRNRNGGKAPWFEYGCGVSVSDVTENSCVVTFPAAVDDEVVHHYTIEILDEEGRVVTSVNRFSEFYLNSRMPLSYTVDFSGIPAGTVLKAGVVAVDSYGNLSQPICSESFKTPVYTPDPTAVAPIAGLIDIVWNSDGVATDISPLANNVVMGAEKPDMEYDDEYSRLSPHFKGNSQNYYRVDYAGQSLLKEAFQKAFSFEVVYNPDNTDNVCVMSAQENGCAGIEQGAGGKIQFYAYVGGRYCVLTSSVVAVPGQSYHVVATYDAEQEETSIYVNGMYTGSMNAPGKLTFPSDERAHWIAIGGDASPYGYIQYAMSGRIALARMYDKAVNRDEAYQMYLRERSK